MATVAILGAGALGSSLTVPLLDGGHGVRLWGTNLDEQVLMYLAFGRAHPATGVPVDKNAVRMFANNELDAALTGADSVVLAVSPDGLQPVLKRAIKVLQPEQQLICLTRGFVEREGSGKISPLTAALPRLLPPRLQASPLVFGGGGLRALDLAKRQPTTSVLSSADQAAAQRAQALLASPAHAVAVTGDPTGVAVAAGLVPAYAVALGLAGADWQERVVAQAQQELAQVVVAAGGDRATVDGSAGVGDLLTPSPNRALGERVAAGRPLTGALAELQALKQAATGHLAAAQGFAYGRQLGLTLPLLAAVHAVLHEQAPAAATVQQALEA